MIVRALLIVAVALTLPLPLATSSQILTGRGNTDESFILALSALMVVSASVGATIVWRRPGNRIGTLLVAGAVMLTTAATSWQGQFYGPLAGIAPGEVALLDVIPVPGAPVRLSSGILVVYADDESFTFMTPEGHMLSAWITFSAVREGGVTIAQAQALERTSDPFDELAYMFGVSRMNNAFWTKTLENLARHVGVAEPAVTAQVICVDRRRQWRHAGNIRYSATLGTARHTLAAPVRWIARRG